MAFAEVMHTALAYFQAGRPEEAYRLMKSSFLDGMYLRNSRGNLGQVSFYDAARGECYRRADERRFTDACRNGRHRVRQRQETRPHRVYHQHKRR